MTEKEKMLAGIVYSAIDKELLVELYATKEAIYDYNRLRPLQSTERLQMLKELLGSIGDDVTIGASSVVVSDIPSDVVAVGNPCRVMKHLTKNKNK